MKTNKQAEDFEALSGIQQIILRPQMWIGSMSPLTQKMFMVNGEGVEYKEVTFIPAFRKIMDEVLDNSIDVLIKECKGKGKVKVVMDKEWIYIEDDGPGIPVIRKDIKDITDNRMSNEEKQKIANTYLPEIAWTRLFSGSNFKDSADKTTIGSHGLGSKCTSIFSKKFVGISDDGKKMCKVVAKNNLETVQTEVSESKSHGVRVKFYPDFARFNMTEVDDVYVELMRQRLVCLGITFPGIKFSLNGKQVNVNERAFLNLFSKHITFQTFDRGFIGIYPNDSDEFNFFTYVDGLALTRGGSHIDYIVDKVVGPVREKLTKKYKTIKPADIKNRLSMVVFLRDFPNLKFDSQTKETLTNLPSEITKYFGDSIDWEKLAKTILKNEYILDPIVETFKLKEEVKERVALKQAGRSKVKIDATKYISPTGNDKKYFIIAEGFSAATGISQALGRKGMGYYAGRGVPLNVWDCKVSQMLSNKEFSDITTLLGIDPSKNDNKFLNFDKIVLANDSDIDGLHIQMIYLGWWMKFGKELFNMHKIARLRTPLVILWADQKMTKIFKAFYTLDEYKAYEANHDISKYKKNYFKGLGSWSPEQFQHLFDLAPNGIENFLEYFSLDEKDVVLVDDWLNSDKTDIRKQYLREYNLDIEKV